MDSEMNGWMDRQTDRRTDGQMDKQIDSLFFSTQKSVCWTVSGSHSRSISSISFAPAGSRAELRLSVLFSLREERASASLSAGSAHGPIK